MRRCLIVDESPAVRLMLTKGLAHASDDSRPEVVEAADGDAALAEFERTTPDLVVLDLTLGARSGLPILRRMLAAHPEVPIAVCTAHPRSHPDVAAALDLGAFAFLEKPVRVDAVKRLLADVEAERGSLRRVG